MQAVCLNESKALKGTERGAAGGPEEEELCERRPERNEGQNFMKSGKSVASRENSICKGPESGPQDQRIRKEIRERRELRR